MNARIRLVCPNCAAQYEVDEDVIPVGGRDVQCSNCGQTWLAMRPSQARQDAAGTADSQSAASAPASANADTTPEMSAPSAADDVQEPTVSEVSAAMPPAADEAPTDPVMPPPEEEWIEPPPSRDDYDEIYDVEAEAEAEATHPEVVEEESPEHVRRRALDAAVFDVLREEAEREAAARRAEAGPIESQPDLGLTEAPPAPRQDPPAEERSAFVRGLEPAEAAAEAAAAAMAARPRHEALPNIEEINSTLEGPAPGSPAAPDTGEDREVARSSGFRRGFLLMLILAAAVVALYAYAPRLSEAVPSLSPTLGSFTATVDAGRVWLDGAAQQATEAIRELTQDTAE